MARPDAPKPPAAFPLGFHGVAIVTASTRDQLRMQSAIGTIDALRAMGFKHKEIERMSAGLPVTLRSMGLAATLAILLKGADGERNIADDVARWFGFETTGAGGFIRVLVASDATEVALAEEEAGRLIEEIKRFAVLV
jgi:hypothetical protein